MRNAMPLAIRFSSYPHRQILITTPSCQSPASSAKRASPSSLAADCMRIRPAADARSEPWSSSSDRKVFDIEEMEMAIHSNLPPFRSSRTITSISISKLSNTRCRDVAHRLARYHWERTDISCLAFDNRCARRILRHFYEIEVFNFLSLTLSPRPSVLFIIAGQVMPMRIFGRYHASGFRYFARSKLNIVNRNSAETYRAAKD